MSILLKEQVVELIFRYRNFIISVSEKVLTGQSYYLFLYIFVIIQNDRFT